MKEEFARQAKKSLQLADHLLIASYPLVHDPKILLGVLTNLYDTYKNLIVYALSKETKPLKTTKAQLEQFRYFIGPNIDKQQLKNIQDIYTLYEEHKKSGVEFARKQQLVICDEDYGLRALTSEKLKKHLQSAKQLYKQLVENNEEKK